jgi:hypothetical protein
MKRRTALWLLGPATLVLLVVLAVIDQRLQDTGGPGIIDFELAATEDRADEIKGEWGPDGRDRARLSLIVDYPYLVAYGAFLTLAVAATRDLARGWEWRRWAAFGGAIATFPVLGALFDAVENANLLLVLDDRGAGAAPLLATVFAGGKFLLTGVALLYVLSGLVARVVRRTRA